MDTTTSVNKQIAVYARVSSTNQENDGTIETQLSAVYEYARLNGYRIIHEYLDNGWSGDSIVRPELDKLRVDAKKKIWEAVLMYDPDRLARRYSYQELVMDELREAGVEVIFVTTPTPANGVEKILYGVQGLFAEYERAKIAERFRLGKVRKANEGNIITSEAPFGYTFVPKQGKKGDAFFKHGYYVVNEYEAEVVKNMFYWMAKENITIRGLIKRLQERNITPRKSKRGVWATSTLGKLLRNKTYIGEGHYGASFATVPSKPLKKELYRKIKKSSRKNKPESEWIKIPTPKIIEEELFCEVQERLRINFDTAKRNTKNEYLLAGKIWCTCGKRRAGEGAMNGKHLYYRCTDRIKSFPLSPNCIEAGINARQADSLVWQQVCEIMSTPELMIKQVDRWLHNRKSESGNSGIDIQTVGKEINKVTEQEKRYTTAFGEGLISMEQLKEYLAPLRKKTAELTKLLESENQKAIAKDGSQLPDVIEIRSFAKRAAVKLKNLKFPEKKAILHTVINKVTGTNNELQISGNIPLNSLYHVAFCPEYRNGENTITHDSDNVNQNKIPFELTIQLQNSIVKRISDSKENKRAA